MQIYANSHAYTEDTRTNRNGIIGEITLSTKSFSAEPAAEVHPALRDFPNDGHSDWLWWAVVKQSNPFILDNTSTDYRPIIQMIDNIERNHKLFTTPAVEGRIGVPNNISPY